MIKRFIHRLFIKDNQKLVRKRFVNVEFDVFYQAMDEFVLKYFESHHSAELIQYLVSVIGVKPKNSPQRRSLITKEADDFRILMDSFSKRRYDKIHESIYFKVLVNFISQGTLPDSGKPCYEHLKNTEKKYISKDPENYTSILEDLFEKCKIVV